MLDKALFVRHPTTRTCLIERFEPPLRGGRRMPPGIEKDICKMNIDLWMHQNTLMWTRLKISLVCSIRSLSACRVPVGTPPHPAQPNTPTPIEALNLASLAKFAALLSAITTFGLWVMMRTDRLLRNTYWKKIEQLDLGFFPACVFRRSR